MIGAGLKLDLPKPQNDWAISGLRLPTLAQSYGAPLAPPKPSGTAAAGPPAAPGSRAPPGTGRRTVCTRDRRGRDPLAELAAETDRQSSATPTLLRDCTPPRRAAHANSWTLSRVGLRAQRRVEAEDTPRSDQSQERYRPTSACSGELDGPICRGYASV